jgi:hypothetical protein
VRPAGELIRRCPRATHVPARTHPQIGVVGFDGQIELEALRLYGLPEDAAALPCGTPALPVGQREFAAEVAWDLPSLAPGATSLLDVTVTGCGQGDVADAALVSSSRFVELDAAAWSNTTVRVMARNISRSAFDLGAATLSVAVTKRRIREADDGADRGHVAADRYGRLREAELEADFVRCGSATRVPRGGDPPLPPHGASPSI